ncbi:hypothetical protein AAZX31_01G026500 [Glycine max]|uniref:uncharacterized protein LOC114400733 n=1 Tax=Glycine soja TaxID=3848 RepID=UPI0007193C97|nr:uncharacterized protein LOC114400733 [Glycine soja]KAG4403066.1 hypothetical protein GLYMA_01G027433v4 [Glycine max]KAH1161323.1 hypothetical protein GYH30_000283 [Glycine max]|eukprot:XP_025982570.1 uncharacterized protein LOC100801979 [Glycine max]
MSQWRYPPHVSPPFKGYRNEDWQENDGTLNTISMTHPRLPIEQPSCLIKPDSDCELLQPGIRHYKFIEGDHITFIIAGRTFDLIYDSIFKSCKKHVLFRKKPRIVTNEVHP